MGYRPQGHKESDAIEETEQILSPVVAAVVPLLSHV